MGATLGSGEAAASGLRPEGKLDRESVAAFWVDCRRLVGGTARGRVHLDLGGLDAIDSAGVAAVRRLRALCEERGLALEITGEHDQVEEFLRYAAEHAHERSGHERASPGIVAAVGDKALGLWAGARDFVGFFGEFLATVAKVLIHPSRIRVRETAYQLERVGANATGLVFLLSTLMGVIMAMQAASGLSSFHAMSFLANTVAWASTREMGPLLAGVIIAGRSGAGLASELGTMHVEKEVDALTVMGFDVSGLLVLPRVVALLVAGPLLTLVADLAGIFGGMGYGVLSLHLPVQKFVAGVGSALGPGDLYSGIVKGMVFGILVGLIGCFCGLQTERGSESVGRQATRAVVLGILSIVFADALLTGIFQARGW